MQAGDHDRVQYDIRDGSGHRGFERRDAVSVCAERVAKRSAGDHERRAEGENPHIDSSVRSRLLIGAQQREQRIRKQENDDRGEHTQKQRRVQRKAGIVLHGLQIALSEGNARSGAGAEAQQRIEGREDGKNRRRQRDRGHLHGLTRSPHEKYICHIIEDIHQHHADHRQTHLQQQLPDRRFPHHFFTFHFQFLSGRLCFLELSSMLP